MQPLAHIWLQAVPTHALQNCRGVADELRLRTRFFVFCLMIDKLHNFRDMLIRIVGFWSQLINVFLQVI